MTVYDFSAKLNNGSEQNLADYKGKVLLIVNTASQVRLHPAIQRSARALRQVSRPGPRSPRLSLRPVRPSGARQRRGNQVILRNQLRRQLPAVLQNRGQRRQRASALQVPERRKGRPAGRRHQVELHQVPGRQAGKRRRTFRPNHHSRDDRRRHRGDACEVIEDLTTEARRSRRNRGLHLRIAGIRNPLRRDVLSVAIPSLLIHSSPCPPCLGGDSPRYTEASRMAVSTSAEDLLHRNLRLPDELPRLRKSRGHAHLRGLPAGRTRRRRRPHRVQHLLHSRQGRAEGFPSSQRFQEAPQGQGKRFAVLGCVAQQEGEKIFERAPYVSLVAGSASYRNLPEMLVQIERRGHARHRPRRSPDRPDLRHRVHRAHQSASRIHHHHRRLRQVLRLLRGAVHPRQGAQPHLRFRARRSPPHGRRRIHRRPTSRPERKFLRRSVAQEDASPNCWPPSAKFPESAAYASPPRILATSPKTSSTPSTPFPRSATTCICRCRAVRRACSMPCSATTPARNISSASPG